MQWLHSSRTALTVKFSSSYRLHPCDLSVSTVSHSHRNSTRFQKESNRLTASSIQTKPTHSLPYAPLRTPSPLLFLVYSPSPSHHRKPHALLRSRHAPPTPSDVAQAHGCRALQQHLCLASHPVFKLHPACNPIASPSVRMRPQLLTSRSPDMLPGSRMSPRSSSSAYEQPRPHHNIPSCFISEPPPSEEWLLSN